MRLCFHSLHTGKRTASTTGINRVQRIDEFPFPSYRNAEPKTGSDLGGHRRDSFVSIPFKRETTSQEAHLYGASTIQHVSIPFKRETTSQVIEEGVIVMYTSPQFPFPSNGNAEQKVIH